MKQSKKNNTLAILGSPHSDHITAKMLNIAINLASLRGDNVTYLNLYDKKIQFCRGCRKCLETSECILQEDDIKEISALVRKSDTIILASPVYWANVPAIVKNLFDRLLGVAMKETETFPKPRLKGKSYILLTSCNTAMPFAKIFGQSSGALRAMKEFFHTSGMVCKGIAVCSNTGKRKDVSKRIQYKIEKFFK